MTNRSNAQGVAVLTGVVLVAAFFLPFISTEGFSISAWGLAIHEGLPWTTRALLFGIPVGGVAVLVAGLGSDRSARRACLAVGASILGYVFFKLAWGFLATTGIGLWLTLGAATVALVTSLASKPKITK